MLLLPYPPFPQFYFYSNLSNLQQLWVTAVWFPWGFCFCVCAQRRVYLCIFGCKCLWLFMWWLLADMLSLDSILKPFMMRSWGFLPEKSSSWFRIGSILFLLKWWWFCSFFANPIFCSSLFNHHISKSLHPKVHVYVERKWRRFRNCGLVEKMFMSLWILLRWGMVNGDGSFKMQETGRISNF